MFVERGVNTPLRIEPKYRAAMYIAGNPEASNREVARAVGVDHTTIRRWRLSPEFQQKVGLWKGVTGIDRLFSDSPKNKK